MVNQRNSENGLFKVLCSNDFSGKEKLINKVLEKDKSNDPIDENRFIERIEKFKESIENKLDKAENYEIEEIIENLTFIYDIKNIKEGYLFGNVPEKGEEETIEKFYMFIGKNYTKIGYKQEEDAAYLIHYFNKSSKWGKVNWIRYIIKN